MPGYTNIDLKFKKIVPVSPAKLVFTGLVYNLLNTRQIVEVYGTTGKPDDHGNLVPSVSQFGYISITSPHYSPQADYNHDGLISPVEMKRAFIDARTDYYLDPTNYNGPFRIQLGIGIEF